MPHSLSDPTIRNTRRPINVLWLSRAKLDNYAQSHDDWSNWRGFRHILNEKELVHGMKEALKRLCEGTEDFQLGCVFEDAQESPESWAVTAPETVAEDQPVPIRFATMDPTVHALGTQIHYVGHASILISSHGGALGLSLFLPPGQGSIMELQVTQVSGNFHFQHMAAEMGHHYQTLSVASTVNVEQVQLSLSKRIQELTAEW